MVLLADPCISFGQTTKSAVLAGPGDSSAKAKVYVLGPEDVIVVQGPKAEDLVNKPMRIDARGEVTFPLLGTLHAGGLSVVEFERSLNARAGTFIRVPQLVVTVVEFRSQPVSVIGAVNSPGLHQLQGHKTLIEMISLAGGLRTDAGSTLHITRDGHALPLPGAQYDKATQRATAELSLQSVMSGSTESGRLEVLPHDVIEVPKAASIYVIGEVKKSGGFLLGDQDSISVIQAVSLAEGPERTADLKRARIIRNSQITGHRQEIACDLSKILAGKADDLSLQAHDILYIPGSTGKKVALRALETAITTGSGIAIWGVRP